ncbi:MAG: amidohydrolase, partial [Planctomycetota bacterium]
MSASLSTLASSAPSAIWVIGLLGWSVAITSAQDSSAPEQAQKIAEVIDSELPLKDFFPRPRVQGKFTDLKQAKFPVVDAHSHFFNRLRHDPDQLKAFVELMDRNNIALCVSLDGRLGSRLEEHMKYLWTDYRNRFAIYANVDWVGSGSRDKPESWSCHQPGFSRHTVMQLEEAAKKGISGVKVFKSFGLAYRNPDGSLIQVDDPRFDAIW